MSKLLKKLPILLLCIACVLGLAACASNSPASEASEDDPTSNPDANAVENDDATKADNSAVKIGESVLVVYYSATGNTQTIAQYVADATSGTLFQLEPVEPYTSEDLDYTNNESRASLEHEDATLQDVELVETTVPDWDSYDTVFLGYPIWWGDAAYPMTSFVKANAGNFEGKNVIPFCTSGNTSIEQSANNLAAIADSGTWSYGMRFEPTASRADVDDWINSFILSL